MTKLRVVVLLAVVALLLFPAMASAQGPQLPCRFHGTVQVDGADVADGTPITATIDGDTYTTVTATTESDGPSSYAIKITPPVDTRYDEGAQVTFMIGSDSAGQAGTFEAGANKALDLSIGEAPGPGGAITDVVVSWTDGNSTVIGSTLYLYLGEQPEGPKGDTGATGPQGLQGEAGEDAAGGIALPIVALVIAVIAGGVAIMSMRRKV